MRRLFVTLTLALMTLTATATTASAIDVRNEDGAERVVVVTSPTMTKRVSLPPMSIAIVVCVSTCRFELEGAAGGVDAGGSEVVTVRGGTLVAPEADSRVATVRGR